MSPPRALLLLLRIFQEFTSSNYRRELQRRFFNCGTQLLQHVRRHKEHGGRCKSARVENFSKKIVVKYLLLVP